MKHEILYAIVQFRPYRETEEFANVGVVMCAPKAGFFDYRIETKSFPRVRSFFNELDRQLPKRVTSYIASELGRVKMMTERCNYAPESLSVLFHEVTKTKEGLIYFGNVRPAIIDGELSNILESLYQHHVHHSFAKHPSATEQLEGAMRTLLEQHDLRKHYQLRTLEDDLGLVKARVPFTHQKSGQITKAIRPLSLASNIPSKIVEDTEQWVNRFKRLFDARILVPESVMIPVEFPHSQDDKGIVLAVNLAKKMLLSSKIITVSADDGDQILTFAAQI